MSMLNWCNFNSTQHKRKPLKNINQQTVNFNTTIGRAKRKKDNTVVTVCQKTRVNVGCVFISRQKDGSIFVHTE